MILKCRECDMAARWHVWYVNFPLYANMCDEHAAQVLIHDKDGWPVRAVRLVNANFLQKDDRSFGVTEEWV